MAHINRLILLGSPRMCAETETATSSFKQWQGELHSYRSFNLNLVAKAPSGCFLCPDHLKLLGSAQKRLEIIQSLSFGSWVEIYWDLYRTSRLTWGCQGEKKEEGVNWCGNQNKGNMISAGGQAIFPKNSTGMKFTLKQWKLEEEHQGRKEKKYEERGQTTSLSVVWIVTKS